MLSGRILTSNGWITGSLEFSERIHRIIEGDCLDLMAKIPDRSIDFICADFPYNISGK